MKTVSLRRRFFLHSGIVIFCVMCISVVVVDVSFRSELERSADERLRLYIFNLLAVANKEEGSLSLPTILRNPEFNNISSGLWAMVMDKNNQVLWRSLSLDSQPSIPLQEQKTGSWVRTEVHVDGQPFIAMSYVIAWDTASGLERYRFLVAEDKSLLDTEQVNFRWWLGGGFLFITLFLLSAQQIVLRSSFRPIRALEQEIAALEQGSQKHLKQHYPVELFGVTTNLNALIDKEHAQREKYRASMADLAHSLKTPLAIIKGEYAASKERNALIDKALERIDRSVEYQLRRAVISGHSLLHSGTSVADVLGDLIEALNRVYAESDVEIGLNIEEGIQFYGDENDLMEVFGNLLDNAFRFAKSHIRISATKRNLKLIIVVEDDGEGVAEDQLEQIFYRGERLDRCDWGQGIGLSVVHDIVTSYDGTVKAGRSSFGGACFTLTFPTKEGES